MIWRFSAAAAALGSKTSSPGRWRRGAGSISTASRPSLGSPPSSARWGGSPSLGCLDTPPAASTTPTYTSSPPSESWPGYPPRGGSIQEKRRHNQHDPRRRIHHPPPRQVGAGGGGNRGATFRWAL